MYANTKSVKSTSYEELFLLCYHCQIVCNQIRCDWQELNNYGDWPKHYKNACSFTVPFFSNQKF